MGLRQAADYVLPSERSRRPAPSGPPGGPGGPPGADGSRHDGGNPAGICTHSFSGDGTSDQHHGTPRKCLKFHRGDLLSCAGNS